jgi:hypothetical protein
MPGAWGDQGHKVICEIAFRLVQPNTRAEIRKLSVPMNSSTPSVIPVSGRITHDKETDYTRYSIQRDGARICTLLDG